MRKSLIQAIVVLLIVTMITPDYVYAMTQDQHDAEMNQCVTTNYYANSVHEGDFSITGYAYKDNDITLNVNGVYYQGRTQWDGAFRFDLSNEIVSGDYVELKQGGNVLNVTVQDAEVGRSTQYYNGYFNCAELVGPVTVFEVVEEVIEEELAPEVVEEADEELTLEVVEEEVEAAEEDAEASEELAEEATEEDAEASEEKEATEEEAEVDSEDEVESTEEAVEEDQEVLVEETEEEIVTVQKMNNMMVQTNVATQEVNKRRYTTCPTLAQYRADNPVDTVNGPVRHEITGTIRCITNDQQTSTQSQFRNALQSANVEVIIFMENIDTRDDVWLQERPMGVESSTSQKVIDGNGYTLTITNSNHNFNLVSSNRVSHFVIMNMEDIAFNTTGEHTFINTNSQPIYMNMVNSNYNTANRVTESYIGRGDRSVLNFYGKNFINTTNSNRITFDAEPGYGIWFRQVRIHDHAELIMNARNSGIQLYQNRDAALDSSGNLSGISVGNFSRLEINAGITGVNTPQINRWDNFFEVGDNSTVVINGQYGYHYNNERPTDIVVGKDSHVEFDGSFESGLKLPGRDSNITIQEGSTFKVTGGNYAINDFNNRTRQTTFNIQEGATFIAESNNLDAISVRSNTTFNINNPELLSIRSNASSGRAFSSNGNYTINVTGTMKSWVTNNYNTIPHAIIQNLVNRTFTIRGNVITDSSNLTGLDPNFRDNFRATMNRFDVVDTPIEDPTVDEPVYDTSETITGTGAPNGKITMTNTRTNAQLEVTTNSDGIFTFDISNFDVQANDVLSFVQKYSTITSETIEVTVVGNQLYLKQPADIVFKTTEIGTYTDNIIYRTDSSYEVGVVNTTDNVNWEVTVAASAPLTSEDGSSVSNVLVYKNGESSEPQSIENGPVRVLSESNAVTENNHEKSVQWGADEGILLQVNPLTVKEGSYSTKLNWTLTDGP